MKQIFSSTIIPLLALLSLACSGGSNKAAEAAEEVKAPEPKILRYGVDIEGYELSSNEIKMGQTLGAILNEYGISAYQVDRLDKASKEIFPLKKIRGGNRYTLFLKSDTLGSKKLDYMAYEQDNINYVLFGFVDDSVSISLGEKPTIQRRMKRSAVINSSLWGAVMEAELPYALAAQMEDVYQWTVDFFGIQKGDSFTVIYDEVFVEDTISVGVGQLWGAKFSHAERDYYAIPFKQNDKVEYWEEDGASLRKQMLKAPLKYSRISSTFSYARLHPIYKVYRPHTGVDYAAPSGTPVHSVADGVVTFKAYSGGGGNTIKIKHAGNIATGYLHLSRYAKGIYVGAKVSQGQTIGYVGSTGASTGPHLDYRVWKGGTPINPLKIPQKPTEPISDANKAEFEFIKTRIMAELNGDVEPQDKIMKLDTLYTAKPTVEIKAEE